MKPFAHFMIENSKRTFCIFAGFSDDKMSMWRQQCIAAKEYLSDPYLRVMFSFLTAENDSYEEVLVSILSSSS